MTFEESLQELAESFNGFENISLMIEKQNEELRKISQKIKEITEVLARAKA